jgi:hypothetical protein
MICEVVSPCRLAHIRAVANNLRPEEKAEISLVTARPRRHLMIALWLRSSYSVALMIDGSTAAIGGDSAPILSNESHAWMFTTSLIERAPLAFFRTLRAEIGKQLLIRSKLRSSIIATSDRCARFYRALGFEIGEEENGFREISIGRVGQR